MSTEPGNQDNGHEGTWLGVQITMVWTLFCWCSMNWCQDRINESGQAVSSRDAGRVGGGGRACGKPAEQGDERLLLA